MEESGSVTRILKRLADGDADAAQPLFEHYFDALVRFARAKLAGVSQGGGGPEDLAQSAFARFCIKVQRGLFPDLADRDGLWRLLLRITANKASDRRKKKSLKRDEFDGDNLPGSQPTPEELETSEQECERLLAMLDPIQQQVALLKMHGYKNHEIAGRIDRALRTVERQLQIIRAKWKRELADDQIE